MSAIVTLKAEPRTGSGSRAAYKVRKQGLVPGIVYGHKEDNVAVTVNAEELDRAIRVQHARVLDLQIGGKKETVLIRELQWDTFGKQMLHIDFARVSATDRVKVTVPVELKNTPKVTGGGVLDQPLHSLHIECPATQIPDSVRVDILNLVLGSPIHVSDLKLPEGVKVLDAAEMVVIQLKLPGAEPTPGAIPGDAAAAGPEVIKKEKKADDEDEKK